ncbi:bile acid:sodium symporter [Streptomyces sp. NPDC056670]|uniref:bile acid:sodium symporter n=1 Tax=Streptomyces sp. NPDC056670 TaxID=3345904 RepID=UPI003691C79E
MHVLTVSRSLGWLQRRLTWAIVVAYGAALLLPAPGNAIRQLHLADTSGSADSSYSVTAQGLLLAFVLFTAALQVPSSALPPLLRSPLPLLAGTATGAAVPLLLLPLVAFGLGQLPDSDGCSGLVTGMALIGAMPVAGGATVWGHRAGGNPALLLGLVLTTTLLSPLTIPLTLSLGAHVTRGSYATDLGHLAQSSGGVFALAGVVIPCLAGLLVQALSPRRTLERRLPLLRLLSLASALTLTYTNAAGALGGFLRHPNLPLLTASVLTAAVMCAASFTVGWALAKALHAAHGDTVALTFASGMNNSSASAVLASTQLPTHPQVLLPVLAYSLIQKTGAGLTDSFFARRNAAAAKTAAGSIRVDHSH